MPRDFLKGKIEKFTGKLERAKSAGLCGNQPVRTLGRSSCRSMALLGLQPACAHALQFAKPVLLPRVGRVDCLRTLSGKRARTRYARDTSTTHNYP